MNLKENIHPQLIFVEDKEFEKEELFKYLTEKISEFKNWNQKEILNAVIEREKKLTTAIGLNVAIPHARVDKWGETIITCLKTKNVKNYPSMDNSNVQIIFLFISDKNSPCEHVNIMSKISYLVADNNNIDILKSSETSEEFYDSIIEMCETL